MKLSMSVVLKLYKAVLNESALSCGTNMWEET